LQGEWNAVRPPNASRYTVRRRPWRLCSTPFNCQITAPANSFPRPAVDEPISNRKGQKETAVLAGGCFWGIQAVYQHTKGVISAISGYSGAVAVTARYEQVGGGNTGHA
jgi:hypothetical protein